MDLEYNNKQLVAIEYPGTVINVDKMEKTLGGERIFSVFNDSLKRLELKFRPNDPYCKSAHGDRFNTTNVVLKIVKRTKKKGKIDEAYKVEMLGVASTTYKFKAMADFQVLPVMYDDNRHAKSLLPQLVPHNLHSSSWLDESSPLFIPPPLYSRFDIPQTGYFDVQNKNLAKLDIKKDLPPNIIARIRKSRSGHAVFSTFEETVIVDKPQPEAIAQLRTYPLEVELKSKLEMLFEDRPIWTRTTLMIQLECDRARLKHSLPCTAYYFTNGPWRTTWVRFGYDPRKNPESKPYQILDLRIPNSIAIDESKKRKNYQNLPIKHQSQHRVATINTIDLLPIVGEKSSDKPPKKKLASYEYISGILPSSRQCFFHLCDIHLDEVQELIHRNDGQEEFCHEKDGWCEIGTLEKCREIIMADLSKTVKELKIQN